MASMQQSLASMYLSPRSNEAPSWGRPHQPAEPSPGTASLAALSLTGAAICWDACVGSSLMLLMLDLEQCTHVPVVPAGSCCQDTAS